MSALDAEDWASEAGGAAVALAGDLVTAVDANFDARALEAPTGLVVPLERERHPGRERQHVGPHRLELGVGHLDELDASLSQQLDEANRHEGRVRDGEVVVERGQEGEQMEYLPGPAEVRKVERDHLDPRQRIRELADALVVRPVAAPDEERALVEPEAVSALGQSRSLKARCDGHARFDEVRAEHLDLASPPLLARPEEHCALVRHERGVVDVDRIRIEPLRGLGDDDLGSGIREQLSEGGVLVLHSSQIGLGTPSACLPGRPRPGNRRPHEHAPEPRGHALTAECAGGNLHRMETTARLTTLDAGGGCAAKYAAGRLEELLAGFAPASAENLLVGLSPADDAAVYRLDDDRALVFTTDFFPPMVDDPALFGAIAAANALNDIFAMGARPLLALSVAALPEALPLVTARAIFDGAAEKVAEAGAVLAGGHTIRDAEPKYGLAAIGTVHPDAIWRKSEARAGDTIFLTKPLGTGLVLTAARKKAVGEDEVAAATASMAALNARAAETLRPFEPNAVTDVTGFGLLGHVHEMAERSGVRIVLDAASIPALPGAIAAARRSLTTGADQRNRDYVAGSVTLDGLPEDFAALAFDPQTSGGLLVSIPSERAAVLAAAFDAEGLFLALVGRVEDGSGVEVAS